MGSAPATGVESLDYEIVDSEVARENLKEKSGVEHREYLAMRWGFVVLIGIVTAFVAFSINTAVETIAQLKFRASLHFMNSNLPVLGCLVFAACNVTLVGLAAAVCVFVSPAAAGSGIPEVKAYLNGINSPNILSVKTLIVKIIGSIGSVGGGLAVGKEGPLVHTGACVAALLGAGGSKKYGLTWRWLRYFKNDRDRRDLVTCGAAAGVAAAFRSPLGGVLFALEEATSWWSSPLLWRAFFTNAVVAVSLRNAIKYFSASGFIIFNEFDGGIEYGYKELIPVTILGVVGGLLGALFVKVNVWICGLRRAHINKKGPWMMILEASAIAALTSVLQFSIPWTVPCTPCPENSTLCPNPKWLGNYKNFNCPPDHYNDLASLLFNTNDDAIKNLFSSGTNDEYTYLSLFIFFLIFYGLALITYGISVPSGLFVPVIICGSAYGRMMGKLMSHIVGTQWLTEGTYALLGAASFLGGSMRMTVSLCVILLELTGDLELLPLLMCVLLISKSVGDIFTESIYDTHIHFKGIPLLEASPEGFMDQLKARDAVIETPRSFSGIVKIGTIIDALQFTAHSAFPVVDQLLNSEETIFHGLILRSHLLVILKDKSLFQRSREEHALHLKYSYSSLDLGKPATGKDLKIEDVTITEEDMEMFVDLHPFVNASPYIVSEDMNMSKVYSLFRTLGLRHICVAPKANNLIGILSRKDLLTHHLEEKLEEINHEKEILGKSV